MSDSVKSLLQVNEDATTKHAIINCFPDRFNQDNYSMQCGLFAMEAKLW